MTVWLFQSRAGYADGASYYCIFSYTTSSQYGTTSIIVSPGKTIFHKTWITMNN